MRTPFLLVVAALAFGAFAFVVTRPPPPPFAWLRERPFERDVGARMTTTGRWWQAWQKIYGLALTRAEAEARLGPMMVEHGLTRVERTARDTTYRRPDGQLIATLSEKNPDPRRKPVPKGTRCFLDTWEPRRVPVGETVGFWWRKLLRR